MNALSRSSNRIGSYLKALGGVGQLLTLLGLLPALIDIVAPIIGININVPAVVSVLWFVIAFGLANFRVFEAQTTTDLELQVKEHHVALEKWVSWVNNELVLNPEVSITLHSQLNIYNHNQRPTYVKFSVFSVDSDWEIAKETSEFIVRVDRNVRGLTQSGNPFTLEANEINDNAHIGAVILFRITDSGKGFHSLGALTHLRIVLAALQAGKKPVLLRFDCDVVSIHQSIENGLMERMQHNRDNDTASRQFFHVLKEYWSGKYLNKMGAKK